MKSYKLSELNQDALTGLKARPRIDFSSIFGVVSFCFITVFHILELTIILNSSFSLKLLILNSMFRSSPLLMMFEKEVMLQLESM